MVDFFVHEWSLGSSIKTIGGFLAFDEAVDRLYLQVLLKIEPMRVRYFITSFLILVTRLSVFALLLFDILLVIFFDMLEDMIQNLIVIESWFFGKDLAFSANAMTR